MDDIAARAGISKPMVYAYLGSKEELFVDCLHREGTRLMEAVASAVAPGVWGDLALRRIPGRFILHNGSEDGAENGI